jgi:hypothetical protein
MNERATEYSADEKRVSDFIQDLTKGAIGSGDDPIGFLLASYANLIAERRTMEQVAAAARVEERKQCAELAVSKDVIGYVPDSGCYSCFDNIAKAILARGTSLASGMQFGEQVTATYKNHRGETAVRTIIPKSIRFGESQWHSPQLLLLAYDVEKKLDREFAVKDFAP